MSDDPYFLELEEYHLSSEKAKSLVMKTILSVGIKSPSGGWNNATFDFKEGGITFRELVSIARKSGIVAFVQGRIDNSDDIFGGNSFGISTPTAAFGQVTSEYAGHTKVFKPPMTNQPFESELSNDIMYYREQVCLWSDEHDFTSCTRYYRAYLSACISMVDAFINRHLLIYNYRKQYVDELKELEKIGRLVDRIEFFMEMTSDKNITAINDGAEWIHFKKLKELRNEMTHINTPTLGYSIHEFAEHLNYVRLGVGGLLAKIREAQGKPSLGFIEHLRTAPLVYFNDITMKADGKHIIKRRK